MTQLLIDRAALANAEPTGWQPIETAPKDGSFYLAFGEGKTWTQNQPSGCYPGEWHFAESRGEWRGYSLTDEATHWMPLPAPPLPDNAKYTALPTVDTSCQLRCLQH